MSLPINHVSVKAAIKEYRSLCYLADSEWIDTAFDRLIKEWHCEFIMSGTYISGIEFRDDIYETAFLLRYS